MKIEKLNENKIRITLNIDDLTERDIDFHTFMSNSIESQDIFLDMLDKAEQEVGFNTNDCRLMIEALALKDGSFILTITKFDHSSEKVLNQKRNLHIKRKSPTLNLSKSIYAFDSFDSFCDFCTFLRDTLHEKQIIDFSKTSDLYEYNSSYYLVFNDINAYSSSLKYVTSTITEFAHFVNSSELFERKLKEYGHLVIKDSAMTTCMDYFT